MSRLYRIPCSWQMYGYYEVEAESLEEAIDMALDSSLPDGSYVEGSFEIDHSQLEEELSEERNNE